MKTPKHQQKEWLYEQYAVNKYSADDIGKMSGCCGPIVLKWLRKLDIPIRKISDPYFKPPKNRKFRQYKNREWLQQMYVENGLSGESIADKIRKETGEKICGGTVIKWMVRFGIKRDNRIRRVYVRERHHNWKGGRYRKGGDSYWYVNVNSVQHVEHRYVVEQFLGRKLERNETIHHINGNRGDNRLKNLYLFTEERKHQCYHHHLQMAILSNLNLKSGIINLKKLGVKLITKSNLSSFKE